MISRLQTAAAALALTLLTGCPSPEARLDEFLAASEPFRVVPTESQCDTRVDITGDYLLAVAAILGPDSPILFDASLTVDTTGEPWQLSASLTPLDEQRAPVPPALEGTAELGEDGSFVLDFGEVILPGTANPILPGLDVTTTLIFEGCTLSATVGCGNVDGMISVPVGVPLVGSTFGVVPIGAEGVADLEPVSVCPE